ncbi:MAG TPA: hypothetical protein VK861_09990 [Bacteroidales bacterium]|nr:hypothetical protein [Bacteroidales bacterium]
MKRILFITVAIILLSVTSCKKDKEKELSESIIGEWISAAITVGSDNYYFEASFLSGNKRLLVQFDAQTDAVIRTFDESSYTVDSDEIQISLEMPDFNQQASGDPIMITFFVFMRSDNNTMTWFNAHGGGGEPTIVWTRK